MKYLFLLFVCVVLLPVATAYIANTSSYTIDSIHTGIVGNNASTNSYIFTSTMTYEQAGNNNANTSSYSFELGWLDRYSSTCGNGIIEYLEICDLGTSNGVCPSTCSSSCTINTCTVTQHPGGGGSGGGASTNIVGVTPSSDISASQTLWQIANGDNNIIFSNKDIPLEKIIITTNNSYLSANFVVTVLSDSNIKYSTGKTYKYLQVDHNSLSNDKIVSAKIDFNVDKSWLVANSVLKEDIILLRYDLTWRELSVKILREDDSKVYYEASSPGLSLFAISTKNITVAPGLLSSILNSSNNIISLNNNTTINDSNTNAVASNSANTAVVSSVNKVNSNTSIISEFYNSFFIIFIIRFWMWIALGIIIMILLIGTTITIVRFKSKEQNMIVSISEWILRQEMKGYSENQLIEMLTTHGYSGGEVGYALKSLRSKNYTSLINKWIKDARGEGYSQYQLKEYLLLKGYSSQVIDEVLKDFDPSK